MTNDTTKQVIQCPSCKKQDTIEAHVTTRMPVIVEEGDGIWDWNLAESSGDAIYTCWGCGYETHVAVADDFVVEVDNVR